MGNILTKRKRAKSPQARKPCCVWGEKKGKVSPGDIRNVFHLPGTTTKVKVFQKAEKQGSVEESTRTSPEKHVQCVEVVNPPPRNLDDIFTVTPKKQANQSQTSLREDQSSSSIIDNQSSTRNGSQSETEIVPKDDANVEETGSVKSIDDFASVEDMRPKMRQPVCWESSKSGKDMSDYRPRVTDTNSSMTNVLLDGSMTLEDISSDDLDASSDSEELVKLPCGGMIMSKGCENGRPGAALKKPPAAMEGRPESKEINVSVNAGHGGIEGHEKRDEPTVRHTVDQTKNVSWKDGLQNHEMDLHLETCDELSEVKVQGGLSDVAARNCGEDVTSTIQVTRAASQGHSWLSEDNLEKAKFLLSDENMKTVQSLYHDDSPESPECDLSLKSKVRSAGSRNKRAQGANVSVKSTEGAKYDRRERLPRIGHGLSASLMERMAKMATAKRSLPPHVRVIEEANKTVDTTEQEGDDTNAMRATEEAGPALHAEFEPDEPGGELVRGRYSINFHPNCTGWFVGHHTGVSVCLHFMCSASFRRVKEWDGAFLDSLIKTGIEFHGKLLKTRFHRKPGEGADIPLEKYGDHLETFSDHWFEMEKGRQVFDGDVQYLNPDLGPLADQLPQAIRKALCDDFFNCLITVLDDYGNNLHCMNMACHRGTDCNYYLFIPHPTSASGHHDPNGGRVSLRKFPSVDDLCQFIKETHSAGAYFVLKAFKFKKPSTFKCPGCIQDMIDNHSPGIYSKPLFTGSR